MNTMRLVQILSCIVILSGCTLAYKVPKSGSLAKVRFYAPEVSQSARSVGIYSHTDDNCGGTRKLRKLGGAVQLGGMSSSETDIGMWKDSNIDYSKELYVEVPVVAERPFNFTAAGSYGTANCFLTLSFLPKANAQYEVKLFSENRSCIATIKEISVVGDSIVQTDVPSGKRNKNSCTFFWN